MVLTIPIKFSVGEILDREDTVWATLPPGTGLAHSRIFGTCSVDPLELFLAQVTVERGCWRQDLLPSRQSAPFPRDRGFSLAVPGLGAHDVRTRSMADTPIKVTAHVRRLSGGVIPTPITFQLVLHKQVVNRVIEPWMMITIICSMTDHANFYYLRDHEAAEPNFRKLASGMYELFMSNLPTYRALGEWHLPLVDESDYKEAVKLEDAEIFKKVSTARCARVSYLTHDGRRDIFEDVRLHDDLAATASMGASPMHASPLEHPAQAVGGRERHGNFEGWKQYRKSFPKENGPHTGNRCSGCGHWETGKHVSGCPRSVMEPF